MEPLPVVYVASSFLNGFNAEGVGMKLTCDVNAANAKRMRFSSNTGVRHFTPSVAPGATFLRMAYISRRFFCDALGAASMYSAMVVGLVFGMALYVPATWRQVVEPNQVDLLTSTVSCRLE